MNTPQARAQIKQIKEIRLQHTLDELNGKGRFWCYESNYWILPRVWPDKRKARRVVLNALKVMLLNN